MSPIRGREPADVTVVVDGIEVVAPEGTMLVDAAKRGDVEIPVFCYEPKLGPPVGACRMCLVEIEGLPKLQTACSTPIRDGMVVYTRTDQVIEAQNAVVEFLLVNHPLDCPVCDKGGECPLQDIAMGWGPGKSRFTDPKRHFQKPLPLSPLIRIDRERCILCYRCVRFSQEVSEDEQLQLLDRGAKSYVGTHEDRPYVAPFHGNIIELCPVGALTSEAYRFRARPWDIEDAGSVCTFCPSQCNVKFTVRDERVARVLARDNAEVDDGWLCDKGRFGYQMFASEDRPTEPLIREAGALREASWGEAIELAARELGASRGKVAAIVGGGSSNEEGYLVQRIVRGPLASPHVTSTSHPAPPRELRVALADPALALGTGELDRAEAILVIGTDPLHEMPILELRIRKAVRRAGADLLVATERPTALDGGVAIESRGALDAIRYPPGGGTAFCAELAAALAGEGEHPFAEPLRRAGPVAIIWGERLLAGERGEAAGALLAIVEALGLREKAGSGLYEVPLSANGRGLREVGCVENAGPGLSEAEPGLPADEIRAALEAGELEALILWDVDPVRDFPDPDGWARAIGVARFTLSVSTFGTASAQNADLHLPAETHAEKEGTVTHTDGRLQRIRPSVPRPGSVRPLWQALVELAAALGDETGAGSAAEVFERIAEAVPLYAGLSYDEIGGGGVRWQERPAAAAAAALPRTERSTPEPPASPAEPPPEGKIRLGSYRDLWADYIAERNPALRFLSPAQRLELSPADAVRLGVAGGEAVEVSANGERIRATVAIAERVAAGVGFLIEGTREGAANRLAGSELVEVRPAPPEPAAEPAVYGVPERDARSW